MNKNHFYIIKDSYFETFNDPYLKGNKEGNRPHYYGIEDKEGVTYETIYYHSQLQYIYFNEADHRFSAREEATF